MATRLKSRTRRSRRYLTIVKLVFYTTIVSL